MASAQETVWGQVDELLASPTADYVIAALVLLLGWYGGKLLVRLVGRQVARKLQRPSLTKTVLGGVRAVVMVIATSIAANQLLFSPGDILLSVTVFSAVLGLVLAPIIGSVINGLFLLADQPYEIGDMIEFVEQDKRGYVEDITLRYTKVFTLENSFLVIPNSNMRDRDIINYSAEDTRSRLSLEVLVTYDGDLDRARAIMERAARETPEVVEGGPDIRIGSARYPSAPSTYIKSFADHGVLLDLRYWVKDPYYMPRVRSKIQERIWDGMEDADVEFAYPRRHHVFDESSGTARVSVGDGERPTSAGAGRQSPPAEEQRNPAADGERESADEFDSRD